MTTKILIGHVLDKLAELPDESVHCVITSPPYYGLRDYNTEPQIWGGDHGIHQWGEEIDNDRWGGYRPNAPSNLAGSLQSKNRGSTLSGAAGPKRGQFCHEHQWGDSIRHNGGAQMPGATSQRQGRSNLEAQEKQRDGGQFCVGDAHEHVFEPERMVHTGRNDSGESPSSGAGFHGQAEGYGGNRMASQGQFCIGDAHEWQTESFVAQDGGAGGASSKQVSNHGSQAAKGRVEYATCGCGAWRGHLGLEPTPELYIQHMVQVFREVKRVLRDDGTVWIVIGDCFASGSGGDRKIGEHDETRAKARGQVPGYKSKDLIGIPWMLAFALRADGWYLRSDIIWSKVNCMPESTTDRPTQSHEHILLLSKSARYFYDNFAVAEPAKDVNDDRASRVDSRRDIPRANAHGRSKYRAGNSERRYRTKEVGGPGDNHWGYSIPWESNGTRNMRNVWTTTAEPNPEAHFATFPTIIPRRAILAGTSAKGVCAKCGAPWVREISRTPNPSKWMQDKDGVRGYPATGNHNAQSVKSLHRNGDGVYATASSIGWQPTCKCKKPGDPVLATVLDPFFGSGTTALVAEQLLRDCIGIELSTEYAAMAKKRVNKKAMWRLFQPSAAERGWDTTQWA